MSRRELRHIIDALAEGGLREERAELGTTWRAMFKTEAGKDGRSKSLATNMAQDTDLVI